MTTTWRAALTALLLTTLLSSPAVAQDSAVLQQRATQQSAELDAGRAAAAQADQAAAAALEAHQEAQRAAEQAVRRAHEQDALLAAAQQRATVARARLGRYVGSLYRTGMGNRQLATYGELLDARTPQALFRGLGVTARVGSNQNDAFRELEQAEQAQAQAARRARQAAEQARSALARVAAAEVEAERVVREAAAAVARQVRVLARTEQALAAARRREALIASAARIARQRSSVPLAAIEGALADRPVPECEGGRVHGYPNGRIPTSVLCPLWGTSGMVLRADAAASFDAMSRAYGAHFGEPVCVTDSYRSLPEQVAVAAAKPDLAAVPGSSNHGWGVAVDLCGGIQGFGTPQHRWMVENSMAYGWFLPAWAQRGGGKPEPWHWEYAL